MKKLLIGSLISLSVLSLAGCQMTEQSTATSLVKSEVVAPMANNNDLYEVDHEGRYYVFDDFATYQQFLSVGETAYRKVYIGEGPHGQTLVFGLTGQDKKKTSGIAGIEMFKQTMAASDDFYGETRAEDGRLYVFGSLEDMAQTRKLGDAIYRFTQIGAGPQGQTVVFVLNKSNKKKRPDALIEKFKTHNNMS